MSSVFHIKDILKNHWPSFIKTHKLRQVVIDEVEKVIKCGDWHNGYTSYRCPHCGSMKIVPFRCHSRFCNTCGVAYQSDRAASIAAKLFRCKHRHIVFTIAEELRFYFRKYRFLLDILFKTASSVIIRFTTQINKKEQLIPGMVCGLHTFGRDLKWNPHIHMLVSEGCIGKNTKWRPITFFPFKLLRSSWRTGLLKNMQEALKPVLSENEFINFKNLVNKLYHDHKAGFYVNAPCTEFNNPNTVTKYITRYIGRPAMAQSRISNYDGKNVTFWYQRHNDNKKVTETVSAEQFIEKLIIHIPEKGFNMLRYYGAYSWPNEKHAHMLHMLHKNHLKIYKRYERLWAVRTQLSFNNNPLKCTCGAIMKYEDMYIPGYLPKKPPPIFKSAQQGDKQYGPRIYY